MSSVPVEIARRAPACIVAIGARTPLGRTARSSAAAARAGNTRLAAHPHMVDKAGDPYIVAMNRDSTHPTRIVNRSPRARVQRRSSPV